MLTASVDGMTTRSAGKDVWTDGDEIGVKIGAFEAIGLYKLNSDGSIQDLVEPLHWQNTASANVKAWFPYEPQIDVPLADQSAGLKDIDFLTAIAENQNYRDQVALNFKHQMAKVSCRLVKGDDITAEEFKTVKLTINGCTKASFTEGILSGEDNGWITPTSDYQALLVPQNMTKKDLSK